MKKENWLPIPGYEGRYCVSDHGDVMSMSYMGTGLPGILSFSRSPRGYLSVALQSGQHPKRYSVHSLVALAFLGPRPSGLQINHIDGNKKNNALTNLEYCSVSENRKHAIAIGLIQFAKGSDRPNAKLNENSVREIRRLHAAGVGAASLARQFGVDRGSVRQVLSGKTWRHVGEGSLQ